MDITFDIMNIESPDFLKQLNINELESLCDQIRKFIIDNVSQTGGHLSSNLGCVEAVVALHYVFDSPKDKFLFDVGHQCYTHKILTGRAKEFINLRKKDGLSGFINYNESIHDVLETGHSSTTISAASGFLEAKEINKNIGEVIAFIGDGSIQNGIAFEGLNYIGSQKNQKFIMIINDNEMSISKNVGRLAKSFSKFRIKRGYISLKRITPKFLKTGLTRVISGARTYVYGRNIFQSMGYKYYGPIEGNNLKELIQFYTFAKNCDQSVILHLNTIKGKGYEFSENDQTGKWHGIGKFDIITGEEYNSCNEKSISWSNGIALIISEILKKNENIRLISPATLVGSSLSSLKEQNEEKVIDVGINEEHAVVMAASMSRNGINPIISIYSTFLQRAYDYINEDVARVNNHIIFLIDRSGLVASDGATHQGIFDVSLLSALPNMVICMPSNLYEAKLLIDYAYNYDGPIAIRYPKCNTLKIENINSNLTIINKPIWKSLLPIRYINIITYGEFINMLYSDLKDRNVGLINALFIKPVDMNILKALCNTTVVVIEEVIKSGSLGTMIMELNSKYMLNMNIILLSIDDIYPSIGTREELLKECNIDKEYILKVIDELKGNN